MCIRDRHGMTRQMAVSQSMQTGMQILQASALELRQIIRQALETNPMPVSYTHLDVYKRQPIPMRVLGDILAMSVRVFSAWSFFPSWR